MACYDRNRPIPKGLPNFMFHICILYSFVYHRVEACRACLRSNFFFFFFLFARHVTPRSFFIRFDFHMNIYTWRDLKLIEIQIKPIVTFLRILFFIGYHKNLLYIQNYRIYRISRRVTY